jgi:serine protease Do
VLQDLRVRVAKSVVSIEVARDEDPEGHGGDNGAPSRTHVDYYNRPEGPCTGTIWSADGYIITSAFNVSGEVKRIKVRAPDGKTYEAKKVGYDRRRDIALLKIDAKDLSVLPRAKIEDVRQGDFVAVVGRSPDPDVPTINAGIISATDRMKSTAMQTDAELNYGNVGGPLVNLRGELIGVTCHIKPAAVWGQSGGVGFACKQTEIEKEMSELLAGGPGEGGGEAFLGIMTAEGAKGIEGVQVAQVMEGGPAAQAGVQEGDVIIELAGQKVTTLAELKKVLATKKPGEEVSLKVRRKDPATEAVETKELKVKLGESPE